MTTPDFTHFSPLAPAYDDRTDSDVPIRSARLRRWSETLSLLRGHPGFLLALAFILFVLLAAALPHC
jgi:peptide/nickel transport system permease protein